ncbi:MAG: lysoplasmalogenase [Flavobacteriaceae bacterium]|nr:lysoplasmalogenase [Flavobacteriaceae bacterium]
MKLTKLEKSFTALFFVIVTIELLSSTLKALSSFHNVAKPLIVVSLILFFYLDGKQLANKTRRIMQLALTFSLVGDVLLMFDHVSINYFLTGLISFLLAHVFYILVFLEKKNSLKKPIQFITILIIYALGLFYVLKDGLGNMLIPVIIYMLAILTMAVTAALRKGNVSNLSYNLVFIGVLLFLISDSILAINKFYEKVPYEHILIMSTYAFAQYCIVMGVLKQKN